MILVDNVYILVANLIGWQPVGQWSMVDSSKEHWWLMIRFTFWFTHGWLMTVEDCLLFVITFIGVADEWQGNFTGLI